MRFILLSLLSLGSLLSADLSGKWNFVWNTPGGERRSTVTLTQEGAKVSAAFPDARKPVEGEIKDGRLTLSGNLYSPEAGQDGRFKLEGTVKSASIEGSATWEEHPMTFVAQRAN